MSLPHLRDLSNWQRTIDWNLEKREVAAVYVKVSQGLTFIDATARAKIRGAASVGLPVGGYHFATPGVGSPEAQADRLLSLAPHLPYRRLRACVDCEWNELGLNSAQLAAWYLGFVIRVHRVAGYWPTMYGSPSYLQAFATYHPEVFGRCPLWVAHYGVPRPHVPAPWTHWTAWQWTQSFKDPAVGRVDDSFVADLANLRIPVSQRSILRAVSGGKI